MSVFKRPLENGEVLEDNRFATLNTQVFVAGEVEVVAEAPVEEEAVEGAPVVEDVVAPADATAEEEVLKEEVSAEEAVEEVAPLVAE
jgi:hypothetical protein